MTPKQKREAWPDRFWAKVQKGAGCWIWSGSKQNCGYGHVWLNGRMQLAHRVSYAESLGEIPEGLTVDHLCGNRACVNPAHLEAVTFAENVARSNNPTAINSRKTTCPKGHAYTAVKAGQRAGERYCKTCRAERKAAAA